MNPETDGSENTAGRGFLIVHVTTARGAIPLEGAIVHIRDYREESHPASGDILISTVSGRDGNTPRIALAAPQKGDSLAPTESKIPPYSSYTVEVQAEGYQKQSYFRVPIFDGITAIQPADMIPLSENSRTDSLSPDGERFFESEAPEL